MRARGEPIPARLSGRGVHGIPERAEAIDVASQGAFADLETVGQLGARPEAVRLQE